MNKITVDEDHIYRVDGMKVPSVTQLLKEFGFYGENMLRFADPTFGSAVHLACQYDDAGTLDESSLDESVRLRLVQWRKYKKENYVYVALNEKPLYSKSGFCGTPDKVNKIGISNYVDDIKTSKIRSLATKVQLVMYKRLAKENGFPIHGCREIVLTDDSYEIIPHDTTKEARIMNSMLNIHYYKKG